MSNVKRTPLYEIYRTKAKMINFGGWQLPVQFTSIKDEHEAVRTKAGLFDVSHMGEIEVTGKDALPFLQKVMTNDVSLLKNEQVQYSLMCYETGGTIDDLLIYRKNDTCFLLVVNAANIEKDCAWLQQHQDGDVMIRNVSNEVVQLALQGPFSEKVLQRLSRVDLRAIPSFQFMDNVELCGVKTLISRTGYTGEDGFEIYCHKNDGILLWRKILETGKEDGVIPCGLGARDTLRFEAKLPLYGQELTDEITPIEAGLGFAVKITKEIEFIGKSVLKAQKENGTARKLVGIEMIEKGIPRNGYSVYMNNEKIGEVTTGTQSPTLKKNVGLALLDVDYSNIGTEVDVQIRNKRLKAVVIRTPFYKKRS